MNKALKKLAMVILVVGVTVTATRTLAAVQINTQVLDNISVQLKVYSQGALKTGDKSLAAVSTTLTTSDIIQQLDLIGGFTANPKSSKLVLSTLYSNVLTGTPGAISSNVIGSNILLSWVAGGGTTPNINTNVYLVYSSGATNALSVVTGATTNGFVITNFTLYVIDNLSFPPSPTNVTFTADLALTNNVIYTFGGTTAGATPGGTTPPLTATPFTNGPIRNSAPNTSPYSLGYWVTIIPTVTATATNLVITQYTPGATNVFTNAGPQQICIMTAKSGGTFDLFDVSDWVYFGSGEGARAIYDESGKGLTETDFLGTNIAAQTEYVTKNFGVGIVYGTNGNPPGQTNLIFDQTGLAISTGKLQNLVTGGTAAEKQEFNIYAKTTVAATSGSGYFGGSFTPDGGPVYTNLVTGVTNTPTYNPGEYIYFFNTTFQTNNVGVTQTNTISATAALATGSVTLSYLSAGVEVVPTEP